MRDAINPDENNYYQAMVWLAPQRPEYFDDLQKQNGWTGVRWVYATLNTIPDISDCSTALVVLERFNDEQLARAPDVLQALEARGTLVGAVFVYGSYSALAFHQAWREQLVHPRATSNLRAQIPLVIAFELSSDGCALLKLFNQFTYAAMLACIDWFDVRLAASQWNSPCNYRQIVGSDFDAALTAFRAELPIISSPSLLLLIENDFSLERFSAIGDSLEVSGADYDSALFTSLMPEQEELSRVEIHWLYRST